MAQSTIEYPLKLMSLSKGEPMKIGADVSGKNNMKMQIVYHMLLKTTVTSEAQLKILKSLKDNILNDLNVP